MHRSLDSQPNTQEWMEHLSVGVLLQDATGVVVWSNHKAREILGLSAEQLHNKRAFDTGWTATREDGSPFPAESYPATRALATGQPQRHVVMAFQRPNAKGRLWLEISAEPLTDEQGKIQQLITTLKDITDCRQAEEALLETEQKLALHVQHTPFAAIEWDLDFRVTSWNPAAERIFGYTEKEAQGQPLALFVPNGEREQVTRTLGDLLVRQGNGHGNAHVTRKDGTSLPCVWHNSPIVDTAGKVTGVASLVQPAARTERPSDATSSESEERFRRIVEESGQVFFYVHDKEHILTYVSPAIEKVLGYRVEEVLGKSYETIMADDPVNSVMQQQTDSALESGRMADPYLAQAQRKDGKVIPIEIVESPIVRDGEVVGLQGFVRDVSSRVLAEQALRESEQRLRESEQRFRSLSENASDIITVLDTEGKIAYQSPSVKRLLGYDEQELIGVSAFDLIHPDELARTQSIFAQLVQNPGSTYSTEYRFRHKDGSWVYLETLGRGTENADGTLSIVANSRDVSERKQTEVVMRENEARFRTIIESAPVPMIVTRVATGRILYANQHTADILGLPLEEIIGRITPDFYFDPAERQNVLRAIQKDGTLRDHELQLKRGDGTPLWVVLSLHQTLLEGEPTLIGVLYDVSSRRQADSAVARFTTQLRTAAEVSERLNAIRDPNHLMREVVSLLQTSFDLYHVHIYLLDEGQENLALEVGSGEVGKIMRDRNHAIPLNRQQSLVARAARTREAVLVDDTRYDPTFLPNPLLPETRSELAVPLVARGGGLVGVLDVQDNEAQRFTQDDVNVLNTVASQIAGALENARLFEQVQASLASASVRLNVSQALATAQSEAEVLDRLIEQAGFDKQVQVILSLVEEEEEGKLKRTRVVRSNAFQSGLPRVEIGAIHTPENFPLFQYLSPTESYLTTNLPANEGADARGGANLIMVPIVSGREWLGILSAYSTEPDHFSGTKQVLYQSIAEQGAIALHTARLRAATEREQDLLNSILAALPVGVYVADPTGKPLRVNEAARSLLGREVQDTGAGSYTETYQLIEASTRQSYPEEKLPLVRTLGDGQPHTADDVVVVHPDGSHVSLFINSAPLQNRAGETIGATVTFSDISALKHVEEELRRGETQLAMAQQVARLGSWHWDIASNRITWSEELYHLFGTSPEKFDGSFDAYMTIVHPADRTMLQEIINRSYQTKEPYEVYHRIQLPDGQVRMIHGQGRLNLDESGNLVSMFGSAQDVTEQHEAERTLRETESRQRALLAASPDLFFRFSRDGIFLDVQTSPDTSLLLPAEQIIGSPLHDIMPANVSQATLEAIHRALETHEMQTFEYKLPVPGGFDYFEARVVVSGPDEALAIVRDVTERKESEAERAQRIRYEEGVSAASQALVTEQYLTIALQKVLDYILHGAKADRAYIFENFWDEEDGLCTRQLFESVGPGVPSEIHNPELQHIPWEVMGISRWSGLLGSGQYVAGLVRNFNDEERAQLEDQGIKSILMLPIHVEGQWYGLMGFDDIFEERVWNPGDLRLLQAVADMVGNYIERKRTEGELSRFTQQLQIAAELAGQINSILELDELMATTVEQLQGRFDLYHVHVYLLDQVSQQLVMYKGSGEVGEKLREMGHAIPLSRPRSLVARAARNQEVVLVNDVRQDPTFMSNPLLPDTRAEMAVPLVVGDRVLGVFDVQDNEPNRFTQADVDVFRTLAGQIATALQNARLFEQVQANLEQTRIRLQLSQALAAAQTVEEVLDALTHELGVFPNVTALVGLFDEDAIERTMVIRRAQVFDSPVNLVPVGTRFTHNDLPLLQTLTLEQAVSSSNLTSDERLDPTTRQLISNLGAVSFVALPLTAGKNWFGELVLLSDEEGFFDNPQRLFVYQSLGESTGVSLLGATLFDETQRTAERLRELDRLKSEFLANMSHELRTPLNSIIGYAEIMLMGINGPLNEENQEDLQAIRNSGQHLLHLINDILDLAKIEAGRMVLDIEQVSLDGLLDEVRVSQTGLLLKKPIELHVEVEQDIPLIDADRIRLTQVLTNLVANAIKFTEQGNVWVRANHNEGWVSIAIQDTGIGIAPEDLVKIFEEFRQVDGSSTRRAEGTGLGLAITRHLVQMHGGLIDVQSEAGQGSTFTVHLPVSFVGES